MKTHRKLCIASLILAALIYFGACDTHGVDYYQPQALATHFNGEHYVGSLTCKECHADVYESHIRTAHYNTSTLPSSKTIKGSFQAGRNMVELSEFDIKMKKDGSTFYQHISEKESGKTQSTQKIDAVVGSGVKGQSFLTWDDDKLFQLQASYYPPTDNWINSPGYPDQLMTRPVRDGCLKCHVTFATNLDFSGQGNRYNKDKIVYGVDCEKCHRPAEKHVIFHRENPHVDTAMHMLKLDTLPRQLRLDACAQCHSGPRGAIIQGNSFSFLSGERLDDYSRNFYTGQKNEELDVHGNQYGLLTSSQCFIKSTEMHCGTCHDSHKNQRGKSNLFNQKCMSCHDKSNDSTHCTADNSEVNLMGNNCIDCHMPTKQSKMMSVQLGEKQDEIGVMVRTHLIGIYKTEKDSFDNHIDSSGIEQIKGFIGSL